MNDMRTVTYEEASEFSKKFGAEYIETSAKNSQNIDEIFKKFAVKLVK
jgi:hypothetical protein